MSPLASPFVSPTLVEISAVAVVRAGIDVHDRSAVQAFLHHAAFRSCPLDALTDAVLSRLTSGGRPASAGPRPSSRQERP